MTGEKQRTSTNSTVANDATQPKPKGLPAADMHKGKDDAARCMYLDMEHKQHEPKSTGNCKEMEHLNAAVLGVSK